MVDVDSERIYTYYVDLNPDFRVFGFGEISSPRSLAIQMSIIATIIQSVRGYAEKNMCIPSMYCVHVLCGSWSLYELLVRLQHHLQDKEQKNESRWLTWFAVLGILLLIHFFYA